MGLSKVRPAYPPEAHKKARRLRKAGMAYSDIAKQIGASPNTIIRWLDPEMHERNLAASRLYKQTKMKRAVCIDCGGPAYRSGEKASKRCWKCHSIWYQTVREPKWPKEKILTAIHRWVEEYGRPPRAHDWQHCGEWWPSYNSVYGPRSPFPTWRDALQTAGYDTPEHTHKNKGPHSRTWSVESALRLRKQGYSDGYIAEKFGVSNSAIYQALGPRRDKFPVTKTRKNSPRLKKKLKNRTRAERIADLQKALAKQK